MRAIAMRIDAHHHIWDLDAVRYPWLMAKGERRFFGDPTPIQRNYLAEEFRSDAEACGFEASVHIQVGADDGMAEAKWVQSVHDSCGWPTVQVGFCDVASDGAKDRLEALAALPTMRGIRQIVGRAPGEDARTGTNELLSDPAFERGLAQVAETGLSFDLQLTPELMEATIGVFRKVPELRVAVCHAGSPHDDSRGGRQLWRRGLAGLAELPGFVCKISGLGMFRHGWTIEDLRPAVEACLELFGPERCMFGSNFPVDSLQSGYANLVSAIEEIVPDGDHEAVFGGTAQEFYRI